MQIPFVGASYISSSIPLDCQRCINFYVSTGESGTSKSVRALFGTPGTRLLATLSGGGVRASYKPSVGDSIVVVGSNVYRVSTAFVGTLVGTIDPQLTPVSIADNGSMAILVNGQYGYTLDLTTNVVAQITDPAFYGAYRVSYNNSTFILDRPGTNQFYITGPGTVTFDALDFGSAETNAEPIVAHIVNHNELLIFKESVTEVWRDNGNIDFPYSRDGNAAIEQGCAAKYSLASLDNTVFWIGRDKNGQGIVWRMNGYTPERVSHDAIEHAIQGYADISDAIGFAQQQDGHTFYWLCFPSADVTWVYDVKERLWHQRAYLRPIDGTLRRHRANCHMFFGGQHVVGDWENGKLYALDLNYFSDNGDPMPAIRSCPHVSDRDYKYIRYNWIEVDMESGVSLQTGQGSNAQMMIRWSDDGGRTWVSLRTMSMGVVGNYRARARKTRMGRARSRVYEVSISDPVKRVVLGAAIDAVGQMR